MPKEISRTTDGLWMASTENQLRIAAKKCPMSELLQDKNTIVTNILNKLRPTRRIELIRRQTRLILQIGQDELNDKIGQIDASIIQEEESILENADSENSNQSHGSLVSNEARNYESDQSQRIPGLNSSGSSTPSTLPSLPSQPISISSESSGNPEEAAEILCFEPQENFNA